MRSRRSGLAGLALAGLALALCESAGAAGFFVSADGHYVSAAHIIAGCQRPAVHMATGWIEGEPVGRSKDYDLALIKVPIEPDAFGRFARDPAKTLRGPVVIVTGHGDGPRGRWINWGRYQRRMQFEANKDSYLALRMKTRVRGGTSGSPALGRDGAVVGLVVAKLQEDIKMALAIDAFTVAQFLASEGVVVSTEDTNGSSRSAEAVVADAFRFTRPVRCLDGKDEEKDKDKDKSKSRGDES